MHILTKEIIFPPVEEADADGFLAIGGDLGITRLLTAYRHGIFPWYNDDEPICWWSPDPRCVLFPKKLRESSSMGKIIREKAFSFTVNSAFEKVMQMCKTVKRKEANGSWIQDEMIDAYTNLHRQGHAVSAEAWQQNELVGGLYGVKIGKVFFGESMFNTISNASKFAFIKFVQQLTEMGIELIDCQQRTAHLESLGAEMIDRKSFVRLLDKYC